MIVISDTSAICYLILIDEIEILANLFGRILIPKSVREELSASGAPKSIQKWIEHPPEWLEIQSVQSVPAGIGAGLHLGESEVFALALKVGADLVILDDRAARQRAAELGIDFIGLLGVLDRAARRQLIDLRQAIRRLRNTSFRVAPALLHRLLLRHQDG